MRKVSADLVITNQGTPLTNGVVIFDETSGVIKDILSSDEGVGDVERLTGLLVPGYVNAHCHLELSHLKGVIPTGTGLIPFIKSVVALRDFPQEEIDARIVEGDREMAANGIVAVGDISNQLDTVAVKQASKIRYYTFVEMFDMLQDDQAASTFENYKKVWDGHLSDGIHKKSIVPHAPYSVSTKLWQLIRESHQAGQTISMHNQELYAENELFLEGNGGFQDFYRDIGMSIEHFQPTGKTSIHAALDNLRSDVTPLFVHNTMTSEEDICAAAQIFDEIYWATCPNANLYIENKLPDYKVFVDQGAKVCIGTDSLSSNWQLSIFEEMKTIKKYQSYLDDKEIIRWGTLHGAQALSYDDLGYMEIGNTPGLNHIDVKVQDGVFDLSQALSSTKIV